MESVAPWIKSFKPWLDSVLILACACLLSYLCRTVLYRRLREWLERAEAKVRDLLADTLRTHVPLWLLLAGVSAATQASPLLEHHRILIHKIIVAGFLLSATLAVSRIASGAIRIYSLRFRTPSATLELTVNLTQITILLFGAMLILTNLGISITPLLTALGVGSLAVALALQDTLANFFAGIHIVAAQLMDVGDFVRLESGQEGFVVTIGWRATRIRDLSNNYVLVPNVKLSQSVIVNYHKPESELVVSVPMTVSYASDLDRVEKTALEIAAHVQKTVPGAVSAFDPVLRFGAFGDSGVQFSVILRAQSFPDRFLLVHEFIKRAHERFRKEGIEIPVPQRAVHLKQQG